MAEIISGDSFEEKVLDSSVPVLVDFFATWCGPCRMLSPILEELEAAHKDSVAFYKVDIDRSPELAMTYGVMSVPTLALFRDGAPARVCVGVRPLEELEEFIG